MNNQSSRRLRCVIALTLILILQTAYTADLIIIEAQLDPNGAYYDAAAFVQAAPDLEKDLGNPDSVTSTYGLGPLILPAGVSIMGDEPLVKLHRSVTMTFTNSTDAPGLLLSLSGTGLFSAVSERSADTDQFHVFIPNDPHYDNPTIPSDDYESDQHGLQQINLETVWEYTLGRSLIGAVDSGIDTDHEDLQGNLRSHLSWGFIPGGIGQTREPSFEEALDPDNGVNALGHGTHVSGIAAATTNNSTGVAGACPECSWVMIRAFGGVSATLGVADLVNQGLNVINLSRGSSDEEVDCTDWGHSSFCSTLILMNNRNVLMVASSGNDVSETVDYPARDFRAVAVGGSDYNAQFWNEGLLPGTCTSECGSNWGTNDVLAPAARILSTLPYIWSNVSGSPTCSTTTFDTDINYGGCTGTSMSAPFVSGVAGLIRSLNPWLDNTSTRSVITTTSTPVTGSPDNAGQIDGTAAIQSTLGSIDSIQVTNRLIPMLTLKSESDVLIGPDNIDEDWLYTSSPQIAMTAIFGQIHRGLSGGVSEFRPQVIYDASISTTTPFTHLSYSDPALSRIYAGRQLLGLWWTHQ